MRRYTLAELQAMPTLHVGHTDDLKVRGDGVRVWLSRLTEADEAVTNEVTVQRLGPDGLWSNVDTYVAR